MYSLFLAAFLQVSAVEPPASAHAATRRAVEIVPRARINENRVAAGTRRGGLLSLRLEVRPARWHPDAANGASETVLAFAEPGRAPSIPGPLVRVRSGTSVQVDIFNPLDRSLRVHGLHTRPSAGDSVIVPAGSRRTLRFEAGAPGTYFYWASTTASLTRRTAEESQLHGAFIVDSVDAPRRATDRVFVMGLWSVPADSTGPKPWLERTQMVINGKSWPHTERFLFAVGDTVNWRWVNPTSDSHPMHLHGFYFDVLSRGTWLADTILAVGERRSVVTELMLPGGTLDTRWVPTSAGNWLFHCHFAFHVSHFLSFAKVPDPPDPGSFGAAPHDAHAMRGLVLGITVRARAGASRPRLETSRRVPRRIRIVARATRAQPGAAAAYAYTIGSDVPARDSSFAPAISDPLVLMRGEPVQITVVNRLRAPTAVHWHGIELGDSYNDGVPGWSGIGNRRAPAIAPGDSFTAAFTPPRAGTFIYHAHSHEGHQIASGLFGALIVVDPVAPLDTAAERTVVIGGNGSAFDQGRVNGEVAPAPMELIAGRRYRFRIVQINPDWRVIVSLASKTGPGEWRPLAKDGAELPAQQRRSQSARVLMGPGETIDVEVAFADVGDRWLDVATQLKGWSVRLPLRVR